MKTWRIRLAVGMISLATLALELVLMRILALRFWQHFAYMVISVSLLGFGASGTLLTLVRERATAHRGTWLFVLALGFAFTALLAPRLMALLSIDLHFLAWDGRQLLRVLAMQALMLPPFLLSGAFVGLVLMDTPERVGGHYAANLVGSGLGAVAAVTLLFVWRAEQLLALMAALPFLAALLLLPGRRAAWAAVPGAVLFAFLAWLRPLEADISIYKRLPFELAAGGEVIHRDHGPLGRIDVVAGPAVHHHPGVSWQFMGDVPRHVLLVIDGDHVSAVYRAVSPQDWLFMDYTPPALAYALREQPASVCLVGAGGGAEIGLALYHGASSVTALEMNRQVIAAMNGPLRELGGAIYEAPGVTVSRQEARGFFVRGDETFRIIHLPPVEAFGAAGGGLYAANEAYLYTVESFDAMWNRLDDEGVLLVSHWVQDPPRAVPRLFDIMVRMLRARGLEPGNHLAMIRGRTMATVAASRRPWNESELRRIRMFCRERGFDPAWLPGLREEETNRRHVLPRPYYYEAAQALLGEGREAFLREYLFDVRAPTDDRPFFFHSFRLRRLADFREQLGGRLRAYMEPGYLLLLGAFVQISGLAALCILLPLAPGIRTLRGTKGKTATFTFFLAIGTGFMMLEMSLLGRLILYLAHPIYSASAVIASFLVFAGLGSRVSARWQGSERPIVVRAGILAAVLGAAYALGLNRWLALSQAAPLAARFAIACATLAPLGLVMGHLFPAGMRQLGRAAPPLRSWAWAVNGFASVLAAVGTPLLAMHWGYRRVGLVAAACYLLAAAAGRLLPDRDAKTMRKS